MQIDNSIIVVTSAGSALGSAIAEHFLFFGAQVVLVDHHYQELIDSYHRCRSIATKVQYFYVENYSHASINAILNFVEQKFEQSPDVVINLWHTQPLPSLIDDNPIEMFTHKIANMASSLFSFVQLSSERMRAQNKEGVIVNIVANDEHPESKSSENALSMISGFTQSWAKELHPYNIRIGAVLPPPQSYREKNHLGEIIDDYVRNTEYILENEYFNGRVMSA